LLESKYALIGHEVNAARELISEKKVNNKLQKLWYIRVSI